MIKTYQYTIRDENNDEFTLDCKIEYDTDNTYNTNYYFYDGTTWHKDFIDLEKTSPKDNNLKDEFEEYITRLHDYMVHGTIWEDLRNMEDNSEITKTQFNLVINSKLLSE